ncbi:MAG: hypothetical protein ACUVRC_05495 [Desulfotomaculales bacterium]
MPEPQPGWWTRVQARTRRSAGFALAVVILAGIDLLYHFLPRAVRRLNFRARRTPSEPLNRHTEGR